MSKVQLFATCLVEALRPSVGWAAVALLERLGFDVAVPEGQTCCGQPAYNAGQWHDARAMARHTLTLLERAGDPVVIPSASCTDMIVHGYPELFRDHPEERSRAEALASRTSELSQAVAAAERPPVARSQGRVTFHPPCHQLRGLGVRGVAERLLDGVVGLEREPLGAAEECCGFGGLFSVKLGGVSSAMLSRKLSAIASSGADTVVSCDLSCLIQIEGGLHRRGSRVRARHIAEVLAER